MISRERYENLKLWDERGANLAPVDFRNMREYESTAQTQIDMQAQHQSFVLDLEQLP